MSGGVNDVTIMIGILALFVGLGFILPYTQGEFGVTTTPNSASGVIDANNINAVSNPVTVFSIIGSIASMFFWTFGALPTWLDTIFVVIRIVFVLLIVRLVRSGGG